MCGNNNLCSCFGNNNWWWIIILVLLFCNCGCGNNNGGYCGNDRCGCDNNCGCCEVKRGRPNRGAHSVFENQNMLFRKSSSLALTGAEAVAVC